MAMMMLRVSFKPIRRIGFNKIYRTAFKIYTG
jgi:hypothetical protein